MFKLIAPVMPEDDLQASLAQTLDQLLKPPAMWWAMPIGHIQLTRPQAAKLTRIGLKRGLPDILVLHGVLHGIELKRPGEGLSRARWVPTRSGGRRFVEGQREVFPRLEAAGMKLATCHSVVAVLDQLTAWKIPLRGRIAA
jgi:hypothetical protein